MWAGDIDIDRRRVPPAALAGSVTSTQTSGIRVGVKDRVSASVSVRLCVRVKS